MKKVLKKLLKILIVICALLVMVTNVFAETTAETNVDVFVNGVELSFDVSPTIENGRTLVPIRNISEFFKYEVYWHQDIQTVEIKNNSDILKIVIGQKFYNKNGEQKELDVPAKIKDGRTLVPLRLVVESFGCDVEWEAKTKSVFITKYNVVEVATAKELLESIDNNTKIILTQEEYNLSDVEFVYNEKVNKSEVFDGYEYIVNNVHFLAIEPKNNKTAKIVVEPRYANVLNFYECDNIKIKGLTLGHTTEKGDCTGGVINLYCTSDSSIENCRLYGCGTYGIIASLSHRLNVFNTEIYECTYGGIDMYNCIDVEFSKCIFRDIKEFATFNMYCCENFIIKDSIIKNNEVRSEFFGFINAKDNKNLQFVNCHFINNTYSTLFEKDGIYMENCQIN